MIIAGLDIATTTGVCLGKPGQAPEFSSRDLGKGKSHDERFANVMRLAHELITEHGVTAIGIEEPIINPKRDDKKKLRLLFGLVSGVQGWARLQGIHCETFEIALIDKHFHGAKQVGRATRKAANLRMCQLRGWDPKTEDEADAAAVWEVMCSHMSPSYAAHSGLLFSREAS